MVLTFKGPFFPTTQTRNTCAAIKHTELVDFLLDSFHLAIFYLLLEDPKLHLVSTKKKKLTPAQQTEIANANLHLSTHDGYYQISFV